MKIKLDDVMKAIELASDEFDYYYNTKTGETIMYGDPILTRVDQSNFLKDLEAGDDNKYILLPTKFDINDYQIIDKNHYKNNPLTIINDFQVFYYCQRKGYTNECLAIFILWMVLIHYYT